jgi:hypothetical protein
MALSNAERQRRYVERLKSRAVTDGVSVTPVSDEDIAKLLAPHIQRLEADFEQRVKAEVERRVKAMAPGATPLSWQRAQRDFNLPDADMNEQHKQQAERLRVTWTKARNYYRTFYKELDDVRLQIGDAALRSWCFDQLRIGLDPINITAGLLGEVDGKIIRASLKAARSRK